MCCIITGTYENSQHDCHLSISINDSFTGSVHAMTTTTTSYILSTIEPQNTMSNLDDNDRSNDHKMIKLNTDTSPSLVNLSSLSKSLDMERNLMVNLGEFID